MPVNHAVNRRFALPELLGIARRLLYCDKNPKILWL